MHGKLSVSQTVVGLIPLVLTGLMGGGRVLAEICSAPSFVAAGPFPAGSIPVAVAVADFNGDGKLDLVVANKFSANVSVLLGRGDGTFLAASNYSAGASPASVAVADFNGDSKPDLAVADPGTAAVTVRLGAGDGTFLDVTNYVAGDVPQSVAVGDFNGDGKIDLAVANRSSGDVSVLLGAGDGTFLTATNYDVGADPVFVAAGDFNGDARQDLALANGAVFSDSTGVSVLLADDPFSAATNYNAGTAPRSVAVGDFNGDNKLDLAVANYGSFVHGQLVDSSVSILLGRGDGTFEAPTNYAAGQGPVSVAVGDLNGDGRADLAVANDLSANVSLLLGNGDGTFAAPIHFGAGARPRAVAIGDFNGDGRSDMVIARDGGALLLLNSPTDVTPPTLNNIPGPILRIECLADVPVPPQVTAIDNCDGNVVVTLNTNETGDPCNRVITRQWSAVDTSGNSASFTQTITVQDDTPPVVTGGAIASCYPDLAAAEAAALEATTASDNCSAVTKSVSTVGTCNARITVRATDSCGNFAEITYGTRIDNSPPVFSGLPEAAISVQCLPSPPAVTANDVCDGPRPVSLQETSTGPDCNRTVTRSWSAIDTCGNTASFTQTITVHDDTSPVLTKGSIEAWYPDVASAEAAALAATTATDNCGLVTNTASTVGTCSATVTVRGTDPCGNFAEVTYSTRIDNTPPVFSGLPEATLTVQCMTNVAAPPTVTASDGCDGSRPVSFHETASGSDCASTITRTWTASDTCSNTATFTQTITVHDDTKPTLTKGSVSGRYETVAEAEAAALEATGATDNCGEVTKTVSTAGECPAAITVTGTDACGNQESVTYATCISTDVELAIARTDSSVTVSWPFPSTGFILESTTSLSTPNWQPAGDAPIRNDDRWEVTVPLGEPERYFRLRKP
jgi:hypothetical protein